MENSILFYIISHYTAGRKTVYGYREFLRCTVKQ